MPLSVRDSRCRDRLARSGGDYRRDFFPGEQRPDCVGDRDRELACGPAPELFDVFAQLDDSRKLQACLIDIDLQALAWVGDRRDTAKLQNRIRLINANLVYLAMGRQKLELNDQDLICSIGLTDYFNDKFVVKLLNWIYRRLRPGGKVLVGNFHPGNYCREVMDYILE